MDNLYKSVLAQIVTAGGGVYRGVMDDEKINLSMVLFDSPLTGSTLVLLTEKCTEANVRMHIDRHNALWIKSGSPVKKVSKSARKSATQEMSS